MSWTNNFFYHDCAFSRFHTAKTQGRRSSAQAIAPACRSLQLPVEAGLPCARLPGGRIYDEVTLAREEIQAAAELVLALRIRACTPTAFRACRSRERRHEIGQV